MAYKTLFNLADPNAEIVIKDLCSAHGVFNNVFDKDSRLHAFNDGERNVVLRILTICKMPLEDIIGLSEGDEI